MKFDTDPKPSPFGRLVRLFLDRTFHGGDGSGSGELDLSLGLVLALLALPGALYSLLLFEKYSTLLLWMRGTHNFDPVAATIPDEYFFIVLSMVVTGAAAVWRWDSVFPDRRDFMNLVPLPLSMRLIFTANLVAILYLAGMLALVVNAVSGVIFPLSASSGQESFRYVAQLAGIHLLTVILSSAFSFFAIFATIGLVMAILPHRVFRRISIYLRAAILLFLVTLLSTSFVVPEFVSRLPDTPARLLPPIWFLCLAQLMHGTAKPAVAEFGGMALKGLAFVVGVALAVYVASYRRYFVRIPEKADTDIGVRQRRTSRMVDLLDRSVLRTPLQRAGYRFTIKTLFRSESHSLVVAAFVAMAIVIASQTLFAALGDKSTKIGSFPSAEFLAVPLILAYFITLGLRLAFDMPADHNANWIFRLCVVKDSGECSRLARNVMLTFVWPWAVVVVPLVYGFLWGWSVAATHLTVVVLASLTLVRVLLIGYRKLPFTCSYPPFRHSAILLVLWCIFGFFVFVVFVSKLECWALSQPPYWVPLCLMVAAAWFVAWLRETNLADNDKYLLFDDAATSGFEWLDLGQRL